MDEKTLGKRLQLARKRAGLTQQELCQKAGLSYSTLAKIERGAIRTPSVFTVAHIAAATNTPLEDLLDITPAGLNIPALSNSKKRSKTGVRFVYFDVNGTLARFMEKAFGAIERDSHVPADIVQSMFWHYDGAACRGSMSNEEVEKVLAGGLEIPNFSWEKYYMESIEVTPGIPDLIQWIANNYEVGLLTNNWLGYTDKLIQRGIVPDVKYTAVIESAKVSCSKPEAKIYEMAHDLSGVSANEILLVDDKQAYLAGAEQAGWQILKFEEMDPDTSIARVKEILAF